MFDYFLTFYSVILSGIYSLPNLNRERQISVGSTHCHLALAVEVRQCPLSWRSSLRSGSAHCWGPAVPIEIWSSQEEEEEETEEEGVTLRKPRGPHPADEEGSEFNIDIVSNLVQTIPKIKINDDSWLTSQWYAGFLKVGIPDFTSWSNDVDFGVAPF